MSFKDAIEIWKNWTLLVPAVIFFSALWFFPATLITDTGLAELYSMYRPIFGGLAIVSAFGLGTKVIIEAFKYVGLLIRRIPDKRKQKKQRLKYEEDKIRSIKWDYSSEERELLDACIENNDPKIIVDIGDLRTENLFAGGLLNMIRREPGSQKDIFLIQAWLWERLRKDPDCLRDVKEVREEK